MEAFKLTAYSELEKKRINIFKIAEKMSLKNYFFKAKKEWVAEQREKKSIIELVSYPFHYYDKDENTVYAFFLTLTEQHIDNKSTQFIQRYELKILDLNKAPKNIESHVLEEKSFYSKEQKMHYRVSFSGELGLAEIKRILQEKYKFSVFVEDYCF